MGNTFTGVGHDTLAGTNAGGNSDTFNVNFTTDVVTETTPNVGNIINSTVSYTLSTNVQTLNLLGTTALTGTGNTAASILNSSATGTDKLIGNATTGSDTFYVNHAGDTVTENGTGTADLVVSNTSFTLGANLEKLTLTGTSALSGTGNTLANVIVGAANTSGSSILSDGGLGGNDTITGNSTHGTDTFIVNNAGDHVIETNTATTALIKSSASFNLGAAGVSGVNQLTLTAAGISGTGSTHASILTANSTGADTLIGAATTGNDTFFVYNSGDVVSDGGTGTADLVISSTSVTLGAGIEQLTLTGSTINITGIGNASADLLTSSTGNINALIGNGGNDTFVLNHASDTATELNNAGGADVISSISYTLGSNMSQLTLSGSGALTAKGTTAGSILISNTGADSLIGQANGHNDTFVVHNAGDKITETGNGTADLVQSTVSYSLAPTGTYTAALENLTLQGSTGLSGTGNVLANVIVGNTGADTLSDGGAGGNDTITGNSALGNDTFIVNNANDQVVETNASGGASDIALVRSTVSFTLGAHLEALTLSGSGALVGTGNTLNDVLTSNTGADTLVGNSTQLTGGDTFFVNNASDFVSENGSNTHGLVSSSVTWDLSSGAGHSVGVNNLTLTGTVASGSHLTGTGNTTGGIITDNTTGAGTNVLIGKSTSGADTFVLNHAGDTISEAGTVAASDVVVASVTYSLNSTNTAAMSHLTLTGSGNITGTGNTLSDILVSSTTGTNHLIGNSTNGDDTFFVNHAGDAVTESHASSGVGHAALVTSTISFTLGSNLENLTLTGLGALTGVGNTLANVITGNANTSGSTVLNDGGVGGAGDTMIGNSTNGTDTFVVNNAGDIASEANAGTTSLVQSSISWDLTSGAHNTHIKNVTLTGAGNHLTATGATNGGSIIADATTGTGANTLIGNNDGSHADTFVITHATDVVSEATSSVGDAIISNTSWTLAAGMTSLTLTAANLTGIGNTLGDTLTSSSAGVNTLKGNAALGQVDTFVVNHAGDVVTELGGALHDVVISNTSFTLGTGMTSLTLTAGSLTGTGANTADILTSSSAGKDTLIGHSGSGNDTFYVNFAGDIVTEAGTNTNDLISSTVSFNLGTGGSTGGATTNVNALTLTGTGNHLTATGNTSADVLTDATSGTGTNLLLGKATSGVDTFVVNHVNDTVSEGGSVTGDAVISSVNWTLGAVKFADLTLTGTGALTGVGNALANHITGNANTAGNTVLDDGGAGGAGDTMIGNSTNGTDTFIVANATDHVTETNPTSTALVKSSASFDLSSANVSGVNQLTLTAASIAGTGNSNNDILTDGGANDTLIGNSTVTGGSGGDTFILSHTGDAVTETHAESASLIQSSVSFNLATGAAGGGATGVNQLTLNGAATGQTATGNNANDTIIDSSSGGHNILNDGGSSSHDVLTDNAGNDTFVVSSANDTVTEAFAGSTTAAVQSSVNYTLGAHINSLTLTGGTATIATGNVAGGDTITGNAIDDIISDNNAGAADSLIGNSAVTGDTFLVQNVADTVTEAGSANSASLINVQTSGAGGVTFSLAGTNVRKLEFTVGTGNDTGTAAATGHDTIVGNTGNDVFHDGGSTAAGDSDVLIGNSTAGQDTFFVNNAADSVTETTATNGALIKTTVSFNLFTGAGGTDTGVDKLTLTGAGTGLTLTGNSDNDTITDSGSAGHNVLSDGNHGGHDSLVDNSTAGGDTFIVSSLFDTIAENGTAKGAIQSAVNYTLGANFNSLTLTAGAATTATGNALGGDTLTGNANNDILSDNNGTAADSLVGHSTAAGDTFVVYNTADTVTEAGSATGSLIQVQSGGSNVNYSLAGTGVHKMTFFGTGNDSGVGTTGGDTIIGNTGRDTLSDGGAGAGADSL